MSHNHPPGHQHCSFCHRSHEEAERLIAGPDGVFICDNCVDLCQNILYSEGVATLEAPPEEFRVERLLPPREIMDALDEYVVGQEYAKRVLSVAVYNHYKRIQAGQVGGSVELEKSNILMIGPTGSGKTLLAQTLARILDVPFSIADATALTEAGYVGEDVENILLSLIQAADGDVARAERGIIYIDEIDKITRKANDNPSITRDVSGEGVQQALLKIIEGTTANVPPQGGRKHPHQEFLRINTSNILFICGGMFSGIDEAIGRRVGLKGKMGFQSGGDQEKRSKMEQSELMRKVSPEDLMKFGLIPEFVGRMPVLVTVDALDREALMQILTEPKNALVKQYEHLLSLDGVELVFDDSALGAAADLALERGTGARGLRSIIESRLLDAMFEIPGRTDIKKVVIDDEAIKGERLPHIFGEGDAEIGWLENGNLNPAA